MASDVTPGTSRPRGRRASGRVRARPAQRGRSRAADGLLAVRLSARLLAPRGRTEAVAGIAVVVATAMTLAGALVMAGVLTSFGARHQVLLAREPVPPGPGAATEKSAPLFAQFVDDVGGAEVVRLVVAGDLRSVAPPPGLGRLPGPGEVFASPAAGDLMAVNPYARRLIPGRVVDRVGRAALRDPDEAYVVVGMDRAQVEATGLALPLMRFGASTTGVEDVTSGQLRMLTALVAVVIGGAGIVLLSGVTRLSGRARERRIAVLLLLGAPAGLVRTTAAVQSGALAAVGAGLAVVGAPLVMSALAGSGVFGLRWWPESGRVPGWSVGVLAVATVLVAARLGARGVSTDPWGTRRRIAEQGGGAGRLVPAAFSASVLAGIVAAEVRNQQSGRGLAGAAVVALVVSLLGLLIGVVIGGPSLVRATCSLPRGHGPLAIRIAAARAHHHARSVARLAGSLMVLALLTGIVLGVLDASSQQAQMLGADRLTVNVAVQPGQGPPTSLLAEVLADPALERAAALRAPDSGRAPIEPVISTSDLRPDDLGYQLVLPPAEARAVAAGLYSSLPTLYPLFDVDLAGPRSAVMQNAAVLLALALAALVVLVAVGVGLITLQQDRSGPDAAVMLAGMSRGRLARVRGLEVALAVVPGLGVCAVLALGIATAVTRIDDPTNAVPWRSWTWLTTGAIGVAAVLAAAASVGTPRTATSALRRE